MAKTISTSAACRMVGVKRQEMQALIKAGKLYSQEGMIEVSELVTLFPRRSDKNALVLAKMEVIKDTAKKLRRVDQSTQDVGRKELQKRIKELEIENGMLRRTLLELDEQFELLLKKRR